MKKTKNQVSILVAFLLLLTTILSVFVSGTYTKYTQEVSGIDEAVVAKFKVSSNITEATFKIFDTIYDDVKNGEEEQDVIEGKIAPGTEGKFEVTVQNDSEVWVSYNLDLSLEEGSNKDIPILYSLDGSAYYTLGQFNSMFISNDYKNILQNGSEEVKIPIYWKWDFDSEIDTSIGILDNQKLILKVSVTFEQLDSQNEKNEFGDNYLEVPVFPTLRSDFSAINVADMTACNYSNQSWSYQPLDKFANTTVCRIDFPIKKVSDLKNAYMTVYVVDNDFSKTPTIISEHKIYIPEEQLETTGAVYKWVSATGLNIKVGENQTLAFGRENDTLQFACYTKGSFNEEYTIYQDVVNETRIPKKLSSVYNLCFDVYVKEKAI